MSDNGSNGEKLSDNGSNVSIEEIGPEEIEEIGQIKDNTDVEADASEEKTESSKNESSISPEPKVDGGDSSEDKDVTSSPSQQQTATEPAATDKPAVQTEPAADSPTTAAAQEPAAASLASAPVPAVAAAAAPVEPAAAQVVEVIEEIPRPAPANPPVQKQSHQELVKRSDEDEDEDEDDDDIDETLTERLIGLTEMFPDCVRNGSVAAVSGSWAASKSVYALTRSIAWIFFSTASVLFMPVIIETERMSIMDQQKQQKTQMLLGPGVASSGAPSLGPPPI